MFHHAGNWRCSVEPSLPGGRPAKDRVYRIEDESERSDSMMGIFVQMGGMLLTVFISLFITHLLS